MGPYRSSPTRKSEKVIIEQVGEPDIEVIGDRLIVKRTYQLKARVEWVEVEPSQPEPMFQNFQVKWGLSDFLCHPVVVLCAATITAAWAFFN